MIRDVRDVLVEIGEDQEKLEHAVALIGATLDGFVVEAIDDGERVGEEPLESGGVDQFAGAASFESLVSTNERLIEEVIEAKLFGGKTARDRVRARSLAARS